LNSIVQRNVNVNEILIPNENPNQIETPTEIAILLENERQTDR
jgi:hypothetical protein